MLYDRIRTDQVTARRDRDRVRTNLLTTLLGEAGQIIKSKRRPTPELLGAEPTDPEIMDMLRKFLKNIEETLKVRPSDELALTERDILKAYLPPQMSDAEVRGFIELNYAPEERVRKNMKMILADANAQYPGQMTAQQIAEALQSYEAG